MIETMGEIHEISGAWIDYCCIPPKHFAKYGLNYKVTSRHHQKTPEGLEDKFLAKVREKRLADGLDQPEEKDRVPKKRGRKPKYATDEERDKAQKASMRMSANKMRANMTPEEMRAYNKRQNEKAKIRRESMTPEELEKLRAKQRIYNETYKKRNMEFINSFSDNRRRIKKYFKTGNPEILAPEQIPCLSLIDESKNKWEQAKTVGAQSEILDGISDIVQGLIERSKK